MAPSISEKIRVRIKIALWRGKVFSGSRLWNTQLATDLTKTVDFLHGVRDYTVSYPLARSYCAVRDAADHAAQLDVRDLAGSHGDLRFSLEV